MKFVLPFLNVISTFYTFCSLVNFLSLQENPSVENDELWPYKLAVDCGLLLTFLLQHTTLKSKRLERIGLINPTFNRCLYVWTSNLSLNAMTKLWEPISSYSVWDLPSSPSLRIALTTVHGIAWYLIYASSLMMDFPDLLGLGYSVRRSYSLNRFFEHFRHGSFIGFTTLLIARSHMSLDRALLMTIWTAFMYISWKPDKQDLEYQTAMWTIKKKELSRI